MFSRAKRELEDLVEFCRGAEWGGEPLARNPLVRHKLAQLAIGTEAGLAFSHSVVCNQIKGDMATAAPLSAAAKYLATELTQRVTYTACESMVMYGQVKNSRWAPMSGKYENYYQECMGLNIGVGTSEMMRNLVASLALGLSRSW